MKKILSVTTFVLFVGVITVNALANIIPINNYNTGELSDLLPNLFVPTGLTFSIWGVIYILLTILVITNIIASFKNKSSIYFNALLSINFLLNISWILAWHYRLIPLSLIVMLGIFVTLVLLDNNINKFENSFFKKISYLSIGVYFGWISVALIANITALFVSVGWNGFPLTESIWTVIIILVGSIIAILKLLKSYNIQYSIVFLWAYLGIIIKRINDTPIYNSIIFVTSISMVFIFVIMVYIIFKHYIKKIR